jgi:hypothetical protein
MSEDYRHKEAECRHWAKATDDVVLKMNLLELADTWKIMAESAERTAKNLIRDSVCLTAGTV